MFHFWVYNLQKEKPHLITKNFKRRDCGGPKTPEVWYEVKQELEYLKRRNLSLDSKIQELEVIDKDIWRFSTFTEQIFNFKSEIQQNKVRIEELSKLPGNQTEMIISYKQFKDILVSYNTKASDEIVKGGTLNLNSRLGFIQIRKIVPTTQATKFNPGRIDWGESYKYKKELIAKGITPKDEDHPEGKNWLIYVRQPFYLRWAWVKKYQRACTVKNNRVYVFTPTASSSGTSEDRVPGNKAKLVSAQKENPLLHLKYTVVNLAGKNTSIVLNS